MTGLNWRPPADVTTAAAVIPHLIRAQDRFSQAVEASAMVAARYFLSTNFTSRQRVLAKNATAAADVILINCLISRICHHEKLIRLSDKVIHRSLLSQSRRFVFQIFLEASAQP